MGLELVGSCWGWDGWSEAAHQGNPFPYDCSNGCGTFGGVDEMLQLHTDFREHGSCVVIPTRGIAKGQETIVHERSEDGGTAPVINISIFQSFSK